MLNRKTCDTCQREECLVRDPIELLLSKADFVQASDYPARPFGDVFCAIGWRCDRYLDKEEKKYA